MSIRVRAPRLGQRPTLLTILDLFLWQFPRGPGDRYQIACQKKRQLKIFVRPRVRGLLFRRLGRPATQVSGRSLSRRQSPYIPSGPPPPVGAPPQPPQPPHPPQATAPLPLPRRTAQPP